MKYDIAALKRKMLVKYPFFGSVIASVGYKENKDIKTAGTDGKTIYYNPEYLESLSVEEQTFIFAHEVCHIAFNHILRSKGKNSKLWNIATDGVINQFLKRDGLKMAPGGVDMAEAINYDAEQLYEKLLQEKQQRQQQQSGSSGQSGDSQEQDKQSQEQSGSGLEKNPQEEQQDVGHDTHSMWEQAVKKHKEEQEKSDKKEKTEHEKKQEELEGMGEKDAFKKNLEDKKKQLEELKEAISKQASQAGISTNSVRTVNDIGSSKPIIDWRYVLREAIKYDVDWSYKNATLEDGIVVANLEKLPMPETEIVLDTSGSINEVLLKNFLRECKNILQHTKLKVGCFDTKFYGFHEIRTEEDIENMELVGGGGTDFNVAVGAFSRRVENKIIFTDGEASMPDMPSYAIWIVFGVKKINPKGGKVIYIDNEQLERLCNYQITEETKGRAI
jgi:predicted metal-dependent peptidase